MDTNITRSTSPVIAAAGTRLIIGVFVAVLGVLLTLDNLGFPAAGEALRYWPVVLIALGALKLTSGTNPTFGIVLVVAGTWALAYNLRWLRFTIFDLWPLILIGAGVVMVGQAFGWRIPRSTDSDGTIVAILTNRKVPFDRDFTGARINAFMGGCELDLSRADIAHSPAVIDIFVMWGGVEIYVPDGWEVVGELTPVMAGLEIKVRSAARSDRRLVIRGFALMAGVEVKSAARRIS